MDKFSVFLFSSSTFISSALLSLVAEQPTVAAESPKNSLSEASQKAPKPDIACNQKECRGNAHLASYLKNIAPLAEDFKELERTPEGHLILEISDEESNAAIEMFGCDCITSINALRQLEGNPIGVEGDRILPGPTIKPCNQPRAPQIP
ncbi:hypothetical protein [Gloeocapsa sp. PCC 73106]|uniref:hypothetical protein n=1 Tax=Gloeocapsa sp. PCC 73106 TaxID=102232 RepID=UPI0002ABE643|nr:hypothetical protein [Gloeocapsa sp. PCC 73106]ELR98268.1 hypothetical protein GLO73106DRAFT_00020950 [Gloeocapsa sp. PCC 73106]